MHGPDDGAPAGEAVRALAIRTARESLAQILLIAKDTTSSAVEKVREAARLARLGSDALAKLDEPAAPFQAKPRDDAEIKALYVAQHGTDEGWLGIEGSYFISGVQAGARLAELRKAGQ